MNQEVGLFLHGEESQFLENCRLSSLTPLRGLGIALYLLLVFLNEARSTYLIRIHNVPCVLTHR